MGRRSFYYLLFKCNFVNCQSYCQNWSYLAHLFREFGILLKLYTRTGRYRFHSNPFTRQSHRRSIGCGQLRWSRWTYLDTIENFDNGSVMDSRPSRLSADSGIIDLLRTGVETAEGSRYNTVLLLLFAYWQKTWSNTDQSPYDTIIAIYLPELHQCLWHMGLLFDSKVIIFDTS